MSPPSPRVRTAVLILLIPVVLAISAVVQATQTLLLVASLTYLLVAGGYLWVVTGDTVHRQLQRNDFLLRRGGAWMLILFDISVSLLVTQRFLIGIVTAVMIYLAGALDHASLRITTPSE